jgi:glutathione S-transferase
MADRALTLHVDAAWESPWGFHAFVALDEKQLPFELVPEELPLSDARRAALAERAVLGKIPVLVHHRDTGDHALTESLAISEYLAETFPFPQHPRLFPADLAERSRARQVMSWLRTSLMALRAERPTSRVFDPAPEPAPSLTKAAAAHADELLGVAGRLITPDRTTLFDAWCIADADLALALMRMVSADDELPAHLTAYARTQWARPSVTRYLEYAHAARGSVR